MSDAVKECEDDLDLCGSGKADYKHSQRVLRLVRLIVTNQRVIPHFFLAASVQFNFISIKLIIKNYK